MMRRARLLLALVLACGGFAQTQAPAPAAAPKLKAYRFAKLIDGRGKVWSDAVVVTKGDRVDSVGNSVPDGVEVLDLRPHVAVPGLIDVHTHLTYYWDPAVTPAQQQGRTPQVIVFLAQDNARKTLESGVTTVRDLGASDYNDIAMRDLINRGAMVGPRMFVAGYGLHVSGRPPRPGFVVPPGGTADGVPEVLRVVREQIGSGADWIKMYSSSGTGFDVSTHQTYTYDEMRAAVEVAHNWGKKIAIHSYGGNGARDAVRAGTDSVEHAIDIDDATLADMAKRGIFYVPTVDHNRYYIDAQKQLGYPERQIPEVQAYIDKNQETVRRAHKAGVKIAMGSDAVYTMFGQNTRELEWFVKAGMTPAEALATATSRAAELMGMEKDIGAIAPGAFADIAVIDGDPLADITAVTRHVRCTIKGAVVVAGNCGNAK